MKSRSREIGCYNDPNALQFVRHVDNTAAQVTVKFQNDATSRAFARSCCKTSVRLMNRAPVWQCALATPHFDGLVNRRRYSTALAIELRFSCTKPSIWRLSVARVFSCFVLLLIVWWLSGVWRVYVTLWLQNGPCKVYCCFASIKIIILWHTEHRRSMCCVISPAIRKLAYDLCPLCQFICFWWIRCVRVSMCLCGGWCCVVCVLVKEVVVVVVCVWGGGGGGVVLQRWDKPALRLGH